MRGTLPRNAAQVLTPAPVCTTTILSGLRNWQGQIWLRRVRVEGWAPPKIRPRPRRHLRHKFQLDYRRLPFYCKLYFMDVLYRFHLCSRLAAAAGEAVPSECFAW